jgi:hypothetical protein
MGFIHEIHNSFVIGKKLFIVIHLNIHWCIQEGSTITKITILVQVNHNNLQIDAKLINLMGVKEWCQMSHYMLC